MSRWSDNAGWLTIIVFIIMFFSMVMVISLINKDKPDVPTQTETFKSKCIERGGNPTVKSGWDGDIHVDEYKCEGVDG